MRPKPIRKFSRAAMLLLMMMLTTASAWAENVTVTYKISVSGTLTPIATITNAETGATVCTWDNGIKTLWPANESHEFTDLYRIRLTPNHDLDKTGKNESNNNASTTAFKTEQTTTFSVNVRNTQYYLKSVTFKEDDTEKASLEVAPNNRSGNVTVIGQKFFNYITVELTTDTYYRLTPSNSLSINTTPARTYNNAKYYVAGTNITITPTNASCIVESVSGVNNATIAADKRSFSFAMPAGNISPSASLTEVYQVTPASGITLSPAAYFTYDGAKYYKPNTTITLSSNVPTGQHVTYKASYNNGNKTLTGNTYTVNSTDRDVTLTALLENNTYNVAFNGNGSTAGSMSSQTFTYGTPQNLTANAFTRTGYTFVGWAMSENGDVVYSDQQSVSNLITTDGGTLTLYAKWTANTYTVHFDAGDDQYAKMGETVTISTSGMTVPAGYTSNGITVTPTVDVTDNGNGTYSFTMPADDVTVNVVFAPIYDWATVSQGTEDDPYMIYNKAQLLLLAYRVNGTHGQTANDYRGKWFKLGADIEFTYDPNEDIDDYEENYEAIGGYHNGNLCNFKGHFDGQDYTVSGIRIRKDGTDANNMYQGLFGRMVPSAEIQRVHVTDARIKGRWYVSGIIGYIDGGTVRNCTVTESTITANSDYGTICGNNAGGALRYNYYRHCTVNGTAVISGKGCQGKDVTTTDGAMPMYVAYIDADGNQQRCIDYTEVTSDMTADEYGRINWESGTYVVMSDVTLSGCIWLSGEVINLIVCDGKTFTVNGSSEGAFDGNTLNIYAQSTGTGMGAVNVKKSTSCNHLNIAGGTVTLNADGDSYGLYIYSGYDCGLTVNGGDVTILNNNGSQGAICFDGPGFVSLNGGKLTVTKNAGNSYKAIEGADSNTINFKGGTAEINGRINYFQDINLNGGNVTVNGEIYNWGGYTVTYDFTHATDSYYIQSFSNDLYSEDDCTVTIASGKAFADEDGNIYTGTLSSDDKTTIAGKTLQPLTAVSLADNASNATAIGKLDGVEDIDITLQGRTLYRDGDWNTLCLPFAVSNFTGTPLSGATVKELNGSTSNLNNGTLTLNFSDNLTAIEAGKPYIVRWGTPESPAGGTITDPVFSGVTVDDTNRDVTFTGGSFKGTYAPMSWDEETPSILFLGTGNTLYWPKPSGENIPSLNACRAYFQLTGGATAREFVLNFGEEETNSIHNAQCTIHNEAGAWYSMDGVRLDGKPTRKGLYIHNGCKVVIK